MKISLGLSPSVFSYKNNLINRVMYANISPEVVEEMKKICYNIMRICIMAHYT